MLPEKNNIQSIKFLIKRILTVYLCVLIFNSSIQAQLKLDSSVHSLVIQGIDLILKQDYDRADSLFSKVANLYPDHPVGYLYQAAVMQSYAIDFEARVERQKFDSLLELTRSKAERLESPWKKYFIGAAEGYDAYERVERGDWFSGVRKGMASASSFEEIVEKDSSFYDAYAGIGTYYYWSSRKTAFIRWLPFVKDYRELGINLLVTCAERSVYNRFAAVSALVSIYLDSEEYKQAEKWSRYGLTYYPGNRVFLWGLATSLDHQKYYRETIIAYENLLGNILNAHAPNPYNEIVCRLNLVKSRLALTDTTNVESNLQTILLYKDFNFPDNLQSRVKSKFKEAQNLLSEIGHRHTQTK